MKTIIHKAASRGHANHGWLNARHTFSFANYFDPARVQFGALRVLNDDIIAAGMGFGTHPHDNMEIITIPIHGDLEHKDSTGRHEVIRANDVQIMSAGRGISHSEYNHSKTKEVNLLQIWVFPKQRNIAPRYGQKTYKAEARVNQLQLVVSPQENPDTLWINQDAYFSLGSLEEGFQTAYQLHLPKTNGVYAFVISGKIEIGGQVLEHRDGMGIFEIDNGIFDIKALAKSEVLLMEIPL